MRFQELDGKNYDTLDFTCESRRERDPVMFLARLQVSMRSVNDGRGRGTGTFIDLYSFLRFELMVEDAAVGGTSDPVPNRSFSLWKFGPPFDGSGLFKLLENRIDESAPLLPGNVDPGSVILSRKKDDSVEGANSQSGQAESWSPGVEGALSPKLTVFGSLRPSLALPNNVKDSDLSGGISSSSSNCFKDGVSLCKMRICEVFSISGTEVDVSPFLRISKTGGVCIGDLAPEEPLNNFHSGSSEVILVL